jgi:DNA-binding NtrC family response regulator
MLKRSAVTLNREPLEVSPQPVELAEEYSWPGNLREMRNFITRLLVLRDEKTAASDPCQAERSLEWRTGIVRGAAARTGPESARCRSLNQGPGRDALDS